MKTVFSSLLLTVLAVMLSQRLSAQEFYSSQRSTIDPELQSLAERLLQGKQGSMVAIDPQTGEVKCLAQNSWWVDSLCLPVSQTYEPASTFKVVQALAFLTLGTATPQTRFTCHRGFWDKQLHIGCHPHAPRLDMVGALAHSCNAWFCKAFMQMIRNKSLFKSKVEAMDKWYELLRSLGLGAPLGIDVPGEVGGLLPSGQSLLRKYKGRWNEYTIAWMGMGQGEVTVTPLQLCNLAAIVGNRGYYFVPHVQRYTQSDSLYARFYTPRNTAISDEAWDVVIEGMKQAVSIGTATAVKSTNYVVCGKTGTAENEGEDHSIFIAFAPAEHPRIAICVYVENAGFGADLAAPIGSLIMEKALRGRLSAVSEKKARQWEQYFVLPQSRDSLHVPTVEFIE